MSTRRRTLWHRAWRAVAALLGLVALTVASLGLAAVPQAVTDERQYLQAETCADATPAPHASCLHARKARVATVVIRDEPKQEEFTLRLHKTPGLPREIDMGGEGPLLERLEVGDDVTVTLWRDHAVVVARDGIAQETADTPEDEADVILAVALTLIPIGAFLLHTGASACAGARAWAATGLPAVLVLRLKWALGSTLCVLPAFVLAGLAELGPVGEALLWCTLVPLVRHYLVWKSVRSRGRHARPLAAGSTFL
ncbi:hypothetical protein [Streptomyces omiyaensis]|uniref:Integral membrane protein n=1 Tax=Streptomyces omiyaensis TaxID=68247 RepID=A0ABW7C0T5_9ACTN|nr:hypothetical protein [Streptomyces omiyaensis]GGY76122.1 hypothetical protein GCM10010363_66390 [Streptomyces omiyaensis]